MKKLLTSLNANGTVQHTNSNYIFILFWATQARKLNGFTPVFLVKLFPLFDCMQPCFVIYFTRCEGHQNCTFAATNSLFGDPCPGTKKYIEIRYHCEKGRACVFACERKLMCYVLDLYEINNTHCTTLDSP